MSKKVESPECQHCNVRFKSLFCGLSGEELDSINIGKACTSYKKGQMIFYESAFPQGLFCVNSGKIKVYQLGEQGKEQILRLTKEGDVLGYRALLSGGKYSGSASALEDSSVCFIPKEIVFALLDKNASLSMQLLKILSHDLENAEHKLTNLTQKSVRERLAEALLFIKETYGCESDGATLNAILSREEIANITGTATETTIRLLSEFKQDGLIDLIGKKIKLLNTGQLAHLANVQD